MDAEERLVFLRAEAAFRQYVDVFRNGFIEPRLSLAEDANLPNHIKHLRHLYNLAVKNSETLAYFGNSIQFFVDEVTSNANVEPSQLDESKVASTLRQAAREWSSDGIEERQQSFERIVNALCYYFPEPVRPGTKVLVPGSGLGRLPFELSRRGFNAIGNEFSTHMLLASHAILNRTPKKDAWVIYPYIHTSSHWRTNTDQYRKVNIPDIWPAENENSGSMSMAVGGFEELALSHESMGKLQAVATCFFIDAPYNFLCTLNAITKVVEVGGIWVNFGPLHWHSQDLAVDGLEFSLDDVVALIKDSGWSFLERESGIPATYCSTHPNKMARMLFECNFWVAKKMR